MGVLQKFSCPASSEKLVGEYTCTDPEGSLLWKEPDCDCVSRGGECLQDKRCT